MLNLSRIQLELERAKEKLRNVEETIQKVEGKTFSNGPVRYSSIKVELHSEKNRNPISLEDVKNQRRRVIASAIDSRVQRLTSDDASFNLKRGVRDKREIGIGLKRQGGDLRPQGVFARLSGLPYQQTEDEDEEEFTKKPALPSRVFTTATEAPSRQEVMAAQAVDEQSKQRNKRMFGALVGTLQKFRKEETRVREREEKRLKVEKKLEEDAKREREKLMQEKRELFLEKKRREVEIKRIEWSLNRVKEYEAWEANVIPLKNFIQTQAKPHIFYLPSVHNNKTEDRLSHSQKIIEKMIEKRKNNLKEEIENSEKKARKTATDAIEEEEAENIPDGNEPTNNPEQEINEDFEADNKKNGYLIEGGKDHTESSKEIGGADADKEMDKEKEVEKEPAGTQDLETGKNENDRSAGESKEESPTTVAKEESENESHNNKESRLHEDVQASKNEEDEKQKIEERVDENLSENAKSEENVKNENESNRLEASDNVDEDSDRKELQSESETKREDSIQGKRSKSRETSRSPKNGRRSGTPNKGSVSPKFGSRTKEDRGRSGSRTRRARKLSRSGSRSPAPKRGRRNPPSGKRSSRGRSSSRATGSVSPGRSRSSSSNS